MAEDADDSIVDMEDIGQEGNNDEDSKCLRHIKDGIVLGEPGHRECRVFRSLRPIELPSGIVVIYTHKPETPGKLTQTCCEDQKYDDVPQPIASLFKHCGN